MYWLKGDTPSKMGPAGVAGGSTATMLRVHASPSLNKKAGEAGSPRRGVPSTPPSTVQERQLFHVFD